MSDLILSDEPSASERLDRPPLYLQHYLDEQERRLAHGPVVKPPGSARARIVERRENVIVLEFTDAPKPTGFAPRRAAGFARFWRSGWDVAMVLLLLGAAAACAVSLLQ